MGNQAVPRRNDMLGSIMPLGGGALETQPLAPQDLTGVMGGGGGFVSPLVQGAVSSLEPLVGTDGGVERGAESLPQFNAPSRSPLSPRGDRGISGGNFRSTPSPSPMVGGIRLGDRAVPRGGGYTNSRGVSYGQGEKPIEMGTSYGAIGATPNKGMLGVSGGVGSKVTPDVNYRQKAEQMRRRMQMF